MYYLWELSCKPHNSKAKETLYKTSRRFQMLKTGKVKYLNEYEDSISNLSYTFGDDTLSIL